MDVKGKVITVTGAGRGLGRAIAKMLASKGAKIACVDLNEEDLNETVKVCQEAGGEGKAFICNVSQEAEVEKLFGDIASEMGGLDGLVNNAGITRDALLVKYKGGEIQSKMSMQQWESVIGVNLTGVFLCGREAAAKMLELGVEEGVIVNISSLARKGSFGQTNYSATKSAVCAMAEAWAQELARFNIRTGAVAPGAMNTEMVAAMKEEARQAMVNAIPLKRMGEPSHIAQSVLFIFENDYMTGRVIETDGGLR